MKKFLLFLFFAILIVIAFMWDHELTNFWTEAENRIFILGEISTFFNNISPYFYEYWYLFLVSILLIVLLYFLQKHRKRKIELVKGNPATEGKVVIDANTILSEESLPESEARRLNEIKEKIPKTFEVEEKNTQEPEVILEDDLDVESMQKLLESK